MNEDILKYNNQLNEIDGLLTEKEQSLKKKIFSLAKMEALVFSDPYLTKIYDEMAENGEEKYGYHYNETIQNMIFNDYVLNSSKYLQKYKMAIPKKKKRRDKSGINKLRHDSTVDIKKSEPQPVAETTTAGSAGGAAGYVGYAGPAAWSKSGEPMRKPLYIGGKVVGEGVVGEDHNYLTETTLFKYIAETLNEDIDIYPQKNNVSSYDNKEVKDNIIDKTSAFSSNTVNQWDKSDTDLEDETLKTGVMDEPNLGEDYSNYYQNLDPKNAIAKAKIDHSNALKQNNQGLGDKIVGNLKSHLDSKGYNWKQDPYAMELIGEKAVSKAQQKFMGMVHAVQTGELSPSKVGDAVRQAAKSMKAGDVEDFAATKHEDLPNHVDEDYAITKLNPLKQLGWISMPSYRFGGAAIFEVSPDDSFGKNSGADYVMGSANDAEYVLKPYGENNYIVNQNPMFWQRYIKLDQNTQKVYYMDDDNKFKYLGKYKELDLNPNKNWGHNHDNQRLLSQIENLKKQGATFKFNDAELDYNGLNEDDTNTAENYRSILSRMVKHIDSIQQLVDVLVYFIKHNQITDQQLQKEVILLAKELFNEKNSIQEVSMIDHNSTTMAMSDPINAQSSGMEKASDMTANFDIMSMDEMANAVNDPKVQRLVTLVNELIKMAVDSDGDPIGVVDTSGTWEEPYIYQPIIYQNGQLKITSNSVYGNKPETEVILKRNMEFDGIPTLKNIAKMYRKAIKNNQNSQNKTNMEIQNNMGDEINEMLSELDKLSKIHENLVNMNEDRKPSALVLKDRLGNENEKNFKSDLQHSGTKEIIDVTKQLEYADQQTTVGDNPYKAAEDIERKVSERALENQGDSTADGKHIPKRNLTTDEAKEVDDYRLGLGDYKFDNEVGEKYEERMKADMGDDFYEKRQRRLEVQANQPMYNKDQQPTETKKEDEEDNKFIQNLGENTVLTGRYFNEIGKSRMIDFNLNEAKMIGSDSINDNFFKINLNGLGNTYSNKLNESTKKLEINENVGNIIETHTFYLNEGVVYYVKNTGVLNENHEIKITNTSDIDKMKHLLGYKPSEFINTKGIKRG